MIFSPGDDGGIHFFPNLETLAGDDVGGGTFWLEMISSSEMIEAGLMWLWRGNVKD